MDCQQLSDAELTSRLTELAKQEREALSSLIAHLIEFDKRELYADLGYPSLFVYCTRFLGYAEGAAYRRIRAARAADKFPCILGMLEKGDVHLEAIALLSAHMKPDNHIQLLEQSCGKTVRDIETIVASIAPRPDIRDCIRATGNPVQPSSVNVTVPLNPDVSSIASSEPILLPAPAAVPQKQSIKPLAPQRVHFGFTGSEELLNKLNRARELLRHKYPAGKLEEIFLEVLEAFLARKDPDRRISTKAKTPSHSTKRPCVERRRILALVKKEVWRRDGGRCSFVAPNGRRCEERGGLEFDHALPWALGGSSQDSGNIRLLCRTHNQVLARRVFGRPADKRRRGDPSRKA